MILYFSGTGNSKYVANVISKETRDEVLSINERLKNNDYSPILSDGEIIIVFPNYCGRMPKVVWEYLNKVDIQGKAIRFVCTCFQSGWNASKYCKKLAENKKLTYLGTKSVKMPQGYVANYNIPNQEDADKQVTEATPSIIEIANTIINGVPFKDEKSSLKGKFMTNIMAQMFYPMMVSAKGFKCDGNCVSCGRCEMACPLNNIKIVDGKPQWGEKCTHCMACINTCPQKAINYKNKTQKRNRHMITMNYEK